MPLVTSCRDLGVVVTHNLFPSTHVTEASNRRTPANSINRSFVRKFTSWRISHSMRPFIENDVVSWSPWFKHDIEKVERVERRFTKRLPGFKHSSYHDMQIGATQFAQS